MIAKDKTTTPGPSPRHKAGHKAETQMAFYLRRKFAEAPNIIVFNDLRLERTGEVAQIDHLVIHKHGMIIIESKSVTGEIHINKELEFIRVFKGSKQGMPSPILQAERQAELLRKLLIDNKQQLRKKKVLGLIQGGFKYCPIQVLVAISDQGIIKRPRKNIPELFKADQVANQCEDIINRHIKAARITAPVDSDWGQYFFAPEEHTNVAKFLIKNHTPLQSPQPTQSPPTPPPPAPQQHRPAPVPTHQPQSTPQTPPPPPPSSNKPTPIPSYLCTHCHSTHLEIRYGRSYYFHCHDCEKNTSFKNTCPNCNTTTRTQKRGPEFTSICKACDHASLFFTNPQTQKNSQ